MQKVEKCQEMYNFINSIIGKPYWGSVNIDSIQKGQTNVTIDTSHFNVATIHIEDCKSEEELFLSVFHEYMHIVLFKIGIGFRAKLDSIKLPMMKYAIEDSDQEEENIVYTLTETLGKFLFKQYENRTVSL